MQRLAVQFAERGLTRIRRLKPADGPASPRDVIAGQSSAEQAQAVIDYHLGRLFPVSRPA